MKVESVILGAGVTGLSAGYRSEVRIFEACLRPGGTCTSYAMDCSGRKFFFGQEKKNTYRFERGGGHWIFGTDEKIHKFINSLSPVNSYERRSAVYFPQKNFFVPFPLQNHLSYLPSSLAKSALDEIRSSNPKPVTTLADWLSANFGPTLCDLFFFPFHKQYTAGLYTQILPQDKFKTPVDKDLIIRGAKEKTPFLGYNATFLYPQKGLAHLINKMSQKCHIHFKKKVTRIDLPKKEISFEGGGTINYERIISTLPLNKMVEMCGIDLGLPPAPFNSVQVVNIGAKRGKKCPDYHWLYTPGSQTGFYRIGFYSNVEPAFLPKRPRKNLERVSIYVEKAFRGGDSPSSDKTEELCRDIIRELKDWEFIDEVEVVDPTWIDVAYTWEYPESQWKTKALESLKENHILQIGRYAKWRFQGIAESIKDGFSV